MNDDTSSRPTRSGRRRIVTGVAIGAAGVLSGGVLAMALSASADSGGPGDAGARAPLGYGVPQDPAQAQRPDEHLLTGATKDKVLAAVRAKYPDATVQRVESDSDGVYEAHLLVDGRPVTVEVGQDYAVTGTEAAPQPPRQQSQQP